MGKYFFRMDFNYGGESNIFFCRRKSSNFTNYAGIFGSFNEYEKKTVAAVKEISELRIVTDLKIGVAKHS